MAHHLGRQVVFSNLHNSHMIFELLLLNLLHFSRLINLSSFLVDTSFLIIDIDVDDVVLVEFLRPSLRYPVLDLLLQDVLVRALGKGLLNTLFMQLIELIVEFSNHLLDVLSLFLLIEFVNNGLLQVHLGETNYLALRPDLEL